MKRTISVFCALILIFVLSFTVGAQDVFIVDEGENEFVPPTTAPTTEAATTKSLAPVIDGEAFEGYIGQITGALSGGIGSLLEKFGPELEGFNQGGGNNQGGSGGNTQLPQINISGGVANTKEATTAQEATTAPAVTAPQNAPVQQKEEVPSVLVVNQGKDSDSYLSGSTLTLIIFIAAIVLLVLAIVVALIFMTRKTEFNSAVKNNSTLPSVDRPDTRSQFLTDDDLFDSEDYSNINYWEND